MKELNYKKYPELKYKVKYDSGEYGGYYTEFYSKERFKFIKKYFLFGPTIKVNCSKCLFILSGNIENPSITAEYWRIKVDEEMLKHADKLTRCSEISSGKIVY